MNRLLWVGALALSFSGTGEAQQAPLLGFSAAGSAAERALEKELDARIEAADLRKWMNVIAARPHHAGSPYGKYVADYVAHLFRSWGFETRIETFGVLIPFPRTRRLELVAPSRYVARLEEPALAEDRTSGQRAEQLPVYNAYSADGDVEAPLVYVNQGLPQDYEELERRGIDVRGKIVITRYGGSWRGIKPKVAAEHGAVGCLIYSDPADDGYGHGDPYPRGANRQAWGAQRGSVLDLPLRAGDPLTPGVGATAQAPRIDRRSAETLMKIPVLPISWGDALPLLRALEGPVAPAAWRGALPLTYRIGPGPARVRLALAFDWRTVPAHDVIARLAGAEAPDEWVIRGNHHDAWVNGADDPVSGLVAMLAEAKALGALARNGWRPRRTILFAAWDAEEQGLLGSVEWAEAHAAELRQKAVAYVNGDSTHRGLLRAIGSHTLEPFVSEVARDVIDPDRRVSVLDRLRAATIVQGTGDARKELRARPGLRLGAMGSGSDYTPFLQHLGIASLDLRFGSGDAAGSYHSIFDSIDHYTRFKDPGFVYGVASARVGGRAVLRLANAEVLPFEPAAFAATVRTYLTEVKKLLADRRAEIEERNRQIEEGLPLLAADPREPFVPPQRREPPPALDFAPLDRALGDLQTNADAFARGRTEHGPALSVEARRRLNGILARLEQTLLRPEGLPLRPWYRHAVYAPGFYTGYGVKTLPGVREALEQGRWALAAEQIGKTASVLSAFAASVGKATEALGGPAAIPFEAEIRAYETGDKETPPPKDGILFIGSSSIRLWKTLTADFPKHKVLNRGFGGSQIAHSTAYVDRIVVPYAPRAIVMYAGGNDLNAGKPPGQVIDDFKAFVRAVHAKLPRARIAYIASAPNPARWAQIENVKALNKGVAAFAATDRRLSFIDVFPRMLGEDGKPRPELFVADRLHMNPTGYTLWQGIVGKHLDRLAAAVR